MKNTKNMPNQGKKAVYLNAEINLDLRRELNVKAKRSGETVPDVLHRILCESLDRMDLIESPPLRQTSQTAN